MKRIACLTALASLAACGPAAPPAATVPTVAVTDAWCRPSPNAVPNGGCYATFLSSTDDRLTGGATPRASRLQVHEMSMEGGMMRMGEMTDGLPLPAGEAVTLVPGGNHLMLIGLTGPLVEGETVPLTLRFASAPGVTVQAQVRTPPLPGAAHAGH